MSRVLVCRPEGASARTAARLVELGLSPVVLPLSRTHALPVELRHPKGLGAVAATSANAIRHAPPDLLRSLARFALFAVGSSTAAASQVAGFSRILAMPGDAGGLADAIARARPSGTLLYMAGKVRHPGFERRLSAAGVPFTTIETYDTVGVVHSSPAVGAALDSRPLEAALFYSALAAQGFAELASRRELAELLAPAMLLCLSERVARSLPPSLASKIRIAGEPTEDALLSLLTADGARWSMAPPLSPPA